MAKNIVNEVPQSIELPAVRVIQPLGEFYVASIDSKILCDITKADVRRMIEERPFETYLGIQRPLVGARVRDLESYVNTFDACFPTSIVLAIDRKCAEYDEKKRILRLQNFVDKDAEEQILYIQIARVLDGQHRIEGLKRFAGEKFELSVSVFVDIDVEDQAYIFSTVNLTQTKVSRSLAYDLFELAKTRSPQKTCHKIAVALDQNKKSPFHKRIKRLGSATPGRVGETITQATFVESLLPYITHNAMSDRDLYLRGKRPARVAGSDLRKLPFRNMFIDERDLEIADIVWNYFDAVRDRWPNAWNSGAQGLMLNRTNGFKALMRLLHPAYLYLSEPGIVTSKAAFEKVLGRVKLKDEDFDIETFKPGTSGEALLFGTLRSQASLDSVKLA